MLNVWFAPERPIGGCDASCDVCKLCAVFGIPNFQSKFWMYESYSTIWTRHPMDAIWRSARHPDSLDAHRDGVCRPVKVALIGRQSASCSAQVEQWSDRALSIFSRIQTTRTTKLANHQKCSAVFSLKKIISTTCSADQNHSGQND